MNLFLRAGVLPGVLQAAWILPAALLLAVAAGCAPSAAEAEPVATAPPDLPGLLAALEPARLVDLSHPFDENTIYWPTSPSFELRRDAASLTAGGYWYASNTLCAAEHGGTHLDAPYHFWEEGWTVEEIPVEVLVAAAVVIDVTGAAAANADHAVTVDELRSFEAEHGEIPAGAVALIHTGWDRRWPDRLAYMGDDTPGETSRLHFPGLSPDAARHLVGRGVAGVGIDTASIDAGQSRLFLAHQILGEANVYGLENLANLDRLPPVGATVAALPMKIAGGSGGPVRALAILP